MKDVNKDKKPDNHDKNGRLRPEHKKRRRKVFKIKETVLQQPKTEKTISKLKNVLDGEW